MAHIEIKLYKKQTIYFPKRLNHFAFPNSTAENSYCSVSSSALGNVRLLNLSQSNGCEVVSQYSFSFHCPNNSWSWASHYLLVYLLCGGSVESLPLIFIGLLASFYWNVIITTLFNCKKWFLHLIVEKEKTECTSYVCACVCVCMCVSVYQCTINYSQCQNK